MILYKTLKYLILATIIYLLLRYTPGVDMTVVQSLITTVIILIVCMIVERLCYGFISVSNPENFLDKFKEDNKDKECKDCKVDKTEHFDPRQETGKVVSVGGKCRVVCDGAPSEPPKNTINDPEKVGGPHGGPQNPEPTPVVYTKNSMNPDNNKNSSIDDVGDVDGVDYGSVGKTKAPAQGSIVKAAPEAENRPVVRDFSKPQDAEQFNWGTRYGQTGYDTKSDFGGMFYDENPAYNRFKNNDNVPRNVEGTVKGAIDNKSDRNSEARMLAYDKALEDRARSISGYKGAWQHTGDKSEKLFTTDNNRRIEGTLDDELPYSDYNNLPIAAGYKSHEYEYGYSFLPPEKWYPQPPRPPICVTERRCPVCPALATGAPADAKEFHSTNRITPPDLINTNYINDKLNAGR